MRQTEIIVVVMSANHKVNGYRNEKIPRQGKHCSFPQKLHSLLHYAQVNDLENIVCWSADGKGFHVLNPNEFMKEIAPHFFPNHSSFRSFERMLNIWGFRRERVPSPQKYFWNSNFLRYRPELCRNIVRVENKGTKKMISVSGRQGYVIAQNNIPKWAYEHQQAALEFLTAQRPKAVKKSSKINEKPQSCQFDDTHRQLQAKSLLSQEMIQVSSRRVARKPSQSQPTEDTLLLEPQRQLQQWLLINCAKSENGTARGSKRWREKGDATPSPPLKPQEQLQRWLHAQSACNRSTSPQERRRHLKQKEKSEVVRVSNASARCQATMKRIPAFVQRRRLPTKARYQRPNEQETTTLQEQRMPNVCSDFSSLRCTNDVQIKNDSPNSTASGILEKDSVVLGSISLQPNRSETAFGMLLQSSSFPRGSHNTSLEEGQYDDAPDSLLVLADAAIAGCSETRPGAAAK